VATAKVCLMDMPGSGLGRGGPVEVRGLICMTSQVARDVAAIVGKRRLYADTKRAVALSVAP
jgi:hypothetical protein